MTDGQKNLQICPLCESRYVKYKTEETDKRTWDYYKCESAGHRKVVSHAKMDVSDYLYGVPYYWVCCPTSRDFE